MPALADLPPPDTSAPSAPATPDAPAAPAGVSTAPPAALPIPFNAIAAGQLPGLQIPPIHKGDNVPDALQHFVVQNLHVLMQSGIDYHDLPNHTTVLFNPSVVTKQQIEEAYKKGDLDKVVPTAAAFEEHVKKLASAAQPAPAGPAPAGLSDVEPPAGVAPAGPAGQTPAAPAKRDIAPPGVSHARLANIAPPGPGIKPNPVPDRLSKRPV